MSKLQSQQTHIDSLLYTPNHKNYLSIKTETQHIVQKLARKGFINCYTDSLKKENDSTYYAFINIGKQYTKIFINTTKYQKTLNLKSNQICILISDVEKTLTEFSSLLAKKGLALNQIKLSDFKLLSNELHAELCIHEDKKRTIDKIIIIGFDKFPKSHLNYISKKYKNKTFNTTTTNSITAEFNKIDFCKQIKPSQVLFKKDSTLIYQYIEKKRANTFDGYIGFSNSKNTFSLNGYLDLMLVNLLNSGENFNIYWRSDEKKQKTFQAKIEIPYLFSTPINIKSGLQIFKQDSLFQKTRTEIEVGYQINAKQQAYIGYETIESTPLQEPNQESLNHYNSNFITLNYSYKNNNLDNLFPEKTLITFKMGIGKREDNIKNTNQTKGLLLFNHNFYLTQNQIVTLKNTSQIILSKNILINELFRFGGVNSIRGFNENELQANLATTILTEYRYKLTPTLYAHTLLDYGYYEDATTSFKNNLYSYGLGIGLLNNQNLLNVSFAKGNNTHTNKGNTVVHIGMKLYF